MSRAPAERLFFALWPDAAVRRALAGLRDRVVPAGGARPVADANLHLTVVFLGAVDGAPRRALEQAAGGARLPAFSLRIERVGHRRRAGIVWAAPAEAPAPLVELAARLRRAAVDGGLEVDPRPLAPHVTLARRARHVLPAPVEQVGWEVGSFALVRSERHSRGARYEVVAEWPLVDGPPGP